jgi:hypothetical protein
MPFRKRSGKRPNRIKPGKLVYRAEPIVYLGKASIDQKLFWPKRYSKNVRSHQNGNG